VFDHGFDDLHWNCQCQDSGYFWNERLGYWHRNIRLLVLENSRRGGIAMKCKLLCLTMSCLAFSTLLCAQEAVSPRAQERIQKEVRHELLMLPYFGVFDNIAYKVDGYNVTLLGQVVRPSLKSDAENAVKHIEGVEHLDNQIEVLPPSPMDDRLRLQLFHAIYGYPALQRYALGVQKPIRIIIKNGHVTLEGVVDSEGDKNIAGLRANGVSGTFSVTNNLQVVK
jgi:hyperosmotically inducible protein